MADDDMGTRRELIRAAVRLFASKGFTETTVREICARANSANINAVNYYFGSKEGLYREILKKLFSVIEKEEYNQKIKNKELSPEKRLKEYIKSHCRLYYGTGEIARDYISIFAAEMTGPSSHLDEMIENHLKHQTEEFLQIIGSLLGPKTPNAIIKNCAISIIGQISYISLTWQMFHRLFPKHPEMSRYHEKFAQHIYEFSLGGIDSVRKSLKK